MGSTYPLPYATNNEPKWAVAEGILSTFMGDARRMQKSEPKETLEPESIHYFRKWKTLAEN
jgi:hypothetical protein